MTHPLALRMWPAHLVGLAAVVAAAGLGLWQYDAWQARRDAATVDLTREAPRPLPEVMGSDDPFPGADVGRPVEVTGSWIGSGTVYVSDRERDGVLGYWVVTPVAVGSADAPAIPVVRGWVDAPDDAPAPPTGEVVLDGWLQPTEGTGVVDDDRDDDVVPQVRIADLIQHVDRDLYGAYLVAEEPTPGLERVTASELPRIDRFTGLRNFLYALEWWVFAAFAGYIWWRYVRDETREPDGVTEGSLPSNP